MLILLFSTAKLELISLKIIFGVFQIYSSYHLEIISNMPLFTVNSDTPPIVHAIASIVEIIGFIITIFTFIKVIFINNKLKLVNKRHVFLVTINQKITNLKRISYFVMNQHDINVETYAIIQECKSFLTGIKPTIKNHDISSLKSTISTCKRLLKKEIKITLRRWPIYTKNRKVLVQADIRDFYINLTGTITEIENFILNYQNQLK